MFVARTAPYCCLRWPPPLKRCSLRCRAIFTLALAARQEHCSRNKSLPQRKSNPFAFQENVNTPTTETPVLRTILVLQPINMCMFGPPQKRVNLDIFSQEKKCAFCVFPTRVTYTEIGYIVYLPNLTFQSFTVAHI